MTTQILNRADGRSDLGTEVATIGHLGGQFSPLVVDLDGTLTPTDTLLESVVQVIRRSPLNLLRIPIWLLRGRIGFKTEIAARTSIAPALLPYRPEFLAYLRLEKAGGRKLILATAAHRSIAEGVAAHLAIFDTVIASDSDQNLKGTAKLAAIRARIGNEFVYAGDSRADIPVWRAANAAILVGVSRELAAMVRRQVPIEKEFPADRADIHVWLKALRVHQWLKNLLVFIPLLTAFSFTQLASLVTVVVAFFSFSLAASATYLVNDLWDIESDRAHPRKRFRPFANASIPIVNGLAVAGGLLAVGIGLAWAVSADFLFMLLIYVVLTSAYSWVLKSYVLMDVITLSVLYTLRILAGALAISVPISSWLLAFSVFLFLSLALVKRCSELLALSMSGSASTPGRDYRVTDLTVLWPLGVGAGLSSIVIFGLFISAPDTQARYATPELLWIVAIGLVYWLARLWIKTARGEMHDDPVVYAIKDAGGRTTILAMVVAVLSAKFLTLN